MRVCILVDRPSQYAPFVRQGLEGNGYARLTGDNEPAKRGMRLRTRLGQIHRRRQRRRTESARGNLGERALDSGSDCGVGSSWQLLELDL